MFKQLCTTLALLLASEAFAWDGLPNHYQLRLNADASRASIEADVWIEGKELVLFGVSPTAELKDGQATFLENIRVTDAAGVPVAVSDKGEGEYELAGDRRLRLRYEVRLEHGRFSWPAGAEEVSYRTSEGLMATGYALFLVPGVKMHGPTRVDIDLPAGWTARTPWRRGERANSFVADSRRELVNNALFFGTARADTLHAGGLELTLVMGERYWPQRAVFKELIERQLASYLEMFGKPPLAQRYLIIVNQDPSGDGGAFAGSFSQFLSGDGERATRAIWGRFFAHELLHFWNGHALVPADDKVEWFKEGVTDYLTVATMARNGMADRAYLQQFLENLVRGQRVARMAQGLTSTVEEAAAIDKHKQWLLVYGGGSVAALAMDVELRRASGGKHGLPDVMKAMYAQFGMPGKTYTFDDIVRVTQESTGQDVRALLERIVRSKTMPDQTATFAAIGLQVEQYAYLDAFLLPDPEASKEARARFRQLFGTSAR